MIIMPSLFNFEAPVPPGAHVLQCGRVQLYNYVDGKQQRLSIGQSTSDGKMRPNNRYLQLFPDLVRECYPDAEALFHPSHLDVGLFAFTLGLGYKLGVYPILSEVYGPKLANGIMDFAMYNIHAQKNAQELLATTMQKQMMFSVKAYEDSWYSNMFCNKMDDEHNSLFCKKWLQRSLAICSAKALLSIDGSNIECGSQQCEKVEHGHNKEHTYNKIVSFIWVICASGPHKGMPITYFVYEGSKVDCKALSLVTSRLKAYKVEVAGAILDRGFCTDSCIEELGKLKIPYEIMATSNTEGYNTMMEKHAEQIFNHVDYMLEDSPGRYGVADTNVKFLGKSTTKGCAALFYDDNRGSAQRTVLVRDVVNEYRKLLADPSKLISKGVKKKFAPYLKISGATGITLDKVALEKALHTKGYSMIISSQNRTAAEIDAVYDLRDASEKVFMQVKSQLGYDAIRGHGTESIYNRFFACFIASILRSEMINLSKQHGIDTNLMIARLDNLEYKYNGSRYEYASSLTKEQKCLFSEVGLNNETVASLGEYVNERLKVDVNSVHRPPPQIWTIPGKGEGNSQKKKESSVQCAQSGVDERGKAGGKLQMDKAVAGSSTTSAPIVQDSKPDLLVAEPQVEAPETATTPIEQLPSQVKPAEAPPKATVSRGRGRPPGSKNKKTLAMENSMAQRRANGETILLLPKPQTGRPKNPNTLKREEEERLWRYKAEIAGIPLLVLPKRGRGQPSKEKLKQRDKLIADWKAKVDNGYSLALSG